MPLLSQESLWVLDSTEHGEAISVCYELVDGVESVASGFYGGLTKDWQGQWCIVIAGLHSGRVLIPRKSWLSVWSTKQPADGERT
jgi:hypothetical protein